MHHGQHSTSTTFDIRRMLQGRALDALLSQYLVGGVLQFDTRKTKLTAKRARMHCIIAPCNQSHDMSLKQARH